MLFQDPMDPAQRRLVLVGRHLDGGRSGRTTPFRRYDPEDGRASLRRETHSPSGQTGLSSFQKVVAWEVSLSFPLQTSVSRASARVLGAETDAKCDAHFCSFCQNVKDMPPANEKAAFHRSFLGPGHHTFAQQIPKLHGDRS